MLEQLPAPERFRTSEEVFEALRAACADNADLATFVDIGRSEEKRPIAAVVLGHGPTSVSLVAGAHADEPVGPETLRTLILEGLRRRDILEPLCRDYRFTIIPHVNPDAEARNRRWIEQWPSVESFILHADREQPGRDIEFGYPDMRAENRAVAAFLDLHGPVSLFINLHGMGFAEGAMLLIDRHWSYRTETLQQSFVQAVSSVGLELHDHNRKGEKGFFYIGPGFTTTPEGQAMRDFFLSRGESQTAALFQESSMEFVRRLGGDPLCLVSEVPLFIVPAEAHQSGRPAAYLSFKDTLPELKSRLQKGEPVSDRLSLHGIRPVPLERAVQLQMHVIESGLNAVSSVSIWK